MQNEDSLAAAARARFAEMDMEALRELWSNEGRTEWAEHELRLELIRRGMSERTLADVVEQRSEIAAQRPPSSRDTIWNYGVVGRIAALATTVVWVLLAKSFGGSKAVIAIGCCAIFAAYVYVLTRRVVSQKKHPISASARFAMNWQLVESWTIFVIGVLLAASAVL